MLTPSKSILFYLIAGLALTGCQSVSEKSVNTTSSTKSALSDLVDSQQQSDKHKLTAANSPENLWDAVRREMRLDLHLDQPRVKAQLDWYKKHPQHMNRVAKRATPYYFHIVSEAQKRNIPVELSLLPIVESAFDPFAYSHGRAAGPWQFIPSTGKHFGLSQNWWYDGRRDIISSTDAAYTYLQQLNKRFNGDWLLALAAYNAGGGTVSQAIKRNQKANKATDYWSLQLPKETMIYVPKLLAIAELIKHSEQYSLVLKPIPNQAHFTAVDTGSQIDIAQAAHMAEITTKEMYLLNPGFNRWATAPDGPHRLLVPVHKEETFTQALSLLPDEARMKWAHYKIKSGDSLITIAKKHGTTVEQIRSINQLKGNRIRAGKTLLVPTASKHASEYTLSQQQRHADRQKSISRTTRRKEKHHIVQSGDSFWSIANKHNVGVRQLARWNNMAPGDPLRTGKRLVIWTEPEQAALPTTNRQLIRKLGYKVRSGDSLSRIASRFNVNITDILRWNKLNKSQYLRLGQHLTLYVDVTKQTATN